MELSVEDICQVLARTTLVPVAEVKHLAQLWRREAGEEHADRERFLKWLVRQQYLTEYQAQQMRRGHVDHFFLNQYKILDRIGQGRMAGIFKAVHQLGQIVAIKVLPPSKARQAETFARFQREARMALRLAHPNVVRTFQLGDADGLHYLVMEYLEGEILEDVLKQSGPLSPTDAVRLFHQALLGLQHIFEQGMVHRDLKPANLMLVPAPVVRGGSISTTDCTVKLLDIGLGRMFFDEEANDEQLTASGTLLGSPDYMAPEQARNAHSADIRADIYSLGCGLYACLTGQPPFTDPNPVRIMIRHANEAPRPLRELNPRVPDGLQHILDCMLAKAPDQRYPTPEKAAQALQVFLASASHDSERPRSADPRLQEYLRWLDTQPIEEESTALARQAEGRPSRVPAAASPLAEPPRPLPPPVRSSGSAPGTRPRPVPVPEKTPGPNAQRKRPQPAGADRLLRDLAADEAPPARPMPEVEVIPEPPVKPGMAWGDTFLLGVIVGIGGAAVVGGLAFLVLQFLPRH